MATIPDSRPEYVIAVTNAPAHGLPAGAKEMHVGYVAGPVGEALASAQTPGSEEEFNWLIGPDGTVYELLGWDRATSTLASAYVVGLVRPESDEQRRSLDWLIGQVNRKRGITEVIVGE